MTVRYVDGVPRWFTLLLHMWRRRRCRRLGHVGPAVVGGCCTHCGYAYEVQS